MSEQERAAYRAALAAFLTHCYRAYVDGVQQGMHRAGKPVNQLAVILYPHGGWVLADIHEAVSPFVALAPMPSIEELTTLLEETL